MKSDDRHRNKVTKDRLYEINRKHTGKVEKSKHVPLAEPQDCYYLSRLPNQLKCQIQAIPTISFEEKVVLFQKKMSNAPKHYFNDQPCEHFSCEHLAFYECEVVQARLHNCLAIFCKCDAFILACTNVAGKTTDYGDAVIERISGFLGYKGFKAFPVKGYYELEKVCPKLSGNVWLGDRCANKNHKAAFRNDIELLFEKLSETAMVRKILRHNDTQCSESLHSRQAGTYRKHVQHGKNMHYVHCMAAGILQYTLGHCFIPQLCHTMRTSLSPTALLYYEAKNKVGKWFMKYRNSRHGKKVRASARASLKQIVQTTAVIEHQTEGTYIGKGGCLIAHFDDTSNLPRPQKRNKKN